MKKIFLLAAITLGTACVSQAGVSLGFSFGLPLPAPPVVGAPAPVYGPAPVYSAPAPVYQVPPPVAYGPPAPSIYFSFGPSWGWGHPYYGHYHGYYGHGYYGHGYYGHGGWGHGWHR